VQHINRAAFQVGHVWGQALVLQWQVPSPYTWGWEDTQHGWMPIWTTLVKPATNYCTVVAKSHAKDYANAIEQSLNVLSSVLVQDTAADRNCSTITCIPLF